MNREQLKKLAGWVVMCFAIGSVVVQLVFLLCCVVEQLLVDDEEEDQVAAEAKVPVDAWEKVREFEERYPTPEERLAYFAGWEAHRQEHAEK